MIKLDSTQISTVVLCDLCPWWRGFADNRVAGWKVGGGHEERVHPELTQARRASLMAQKAADAANRHAAM